MRQNDSKASPLLSPRPLRWAIVLAGLLVAGCFISPLGTNTAQEVLPTPGEDGKVTVTFVPAGATPEKVTFTLQPPEGEAVTVEDDSADDGFTATFDTKALALPAGLYPVAISIDDSEEVVAKLAFVMPAEAAPAEGEKSSGGGDEAAPAADEEAAPSDAEAEE